MKDFPDDRFAGFFPGPGFALVKIPLVSETCRMKKEFVFQIERDEDALVAICHDPEMATQGDNLDELIAMIRDLIQCRFEANDERRHWPIRLHFVDDPVLSLQPA
jgi:predicted RNase H-like HicB family nuclease